MMTLGFKAPGEHIVLIGHTKGHVGQSLWLEVCHGRREGPPPPVDLAAERRAGECIRSLIAGGLVSAVHDCSDGGAAIAVAEMALAGNIGLEMTVVEEIANPAAILFGEDQGRFIVTTSDPGSVRAAANAAQLFAVPIGITGGDCVAFDLVGRGGRQSVTLADLRSAYESFFPRLMGEDAALA
jgi:phosphoribosylformylglycinamidine synthase subunit PurL